MSAPQSLQAIMQASEPIRLDWQLTEPERERPFRDLPISKLQPQLTGFLKNLQICILARTSPHDRAA